MLIQFTIENFLSFRERQTFSMRPGRTRLKPHHKSPKINGVSVLRTSLIYGANASGKTNLVKAIEFGKNFILNKTDLGVDYKHFKLAKEYEQKDSRIEFEIQVNQRNYAYGFVFNHDEVKEEWLYEMINNREVKVFERLNQVDYYLEYLYKRNPSDKEKSFIRYTADSTLRSQLFLSKIINTNTDDNLTNLAEIKDVISWFKDSLKIIYPHSKNVDKKIEMVNNADLKKIFTNFLQYFDTGIDELIFENIAYEKARVPSKLKLEIENNLLKSPVKNQTAFVSNTSEDAYYVFMKSKKGKTIVAKKLKVKHFITDKDYVLFDLYEESDGTRRLLDLIPIIIDCKQRQSVYIIDEVERSIHPNLIHDWFDLLLKHMKSQVIAVTHEATLLDQELFRKDEIWLSIKNKHKATELVSINEYNIRFDKLIMKDYLLGRFRGVPKFGDNESLKFE